MLGLVQSYRSALRSPARAGLFALLLAAAACAAPAHPPGLDLPVSPLALAEPAPTDPAESTCREYDEASYGVCMLLMSEYRDEFVPAAGRMADLGTQIRCHPLRQNPDDYVQCVSIAAALSGSGREAGSIASSVPAEMVSAVEVPGVARPERPKPATPHPGYSAEYVANLTACLADSAADSCRIHLLEREHRDAVRRDAYQANLAACLQRPDGPRCQSELLTADDAARVARVPDKGPPAPVLAEPATVAYTRPPIPPALPSFTPAPPLCSESGSCYGDVSTLTGRPEPTHVRGYYRKDGTYVRGHYRSRARRR